MFAISRVVVLIVVHDMLVDAGVSAATVVARMVPTAMMGSEEGACQLFTEFGNCVGNMSQQRGSAVIKMELVTLHQELNTVMKVENEEKKVKKEQEKEVAQKKKLEVARHKRELAEQKKTEAAHQRYELAVARPGR